jgi:dTDP-4-dehydrorhamnose reductase
MLNILITGSNGQLGSEIRAASALFPFHNFIFTDIQELDITDTLKVERFFSAYTIDVGQLRRLYRGRPRRR